VTKEYEMNTMLVATDNHQMTSSFAGYFTEKEGFIARVGWNRFLI
jgi:hypothetical protein